MSESEVSGSDIFLKNSVVFHSGKKYLVKARSGRGKSSLLNFIYGTNSNYNGKIIFENEVIGSTNFHFRKNRISYIFQDLKLFDQLSVFENIELKNRITNEKSAEEIDSLIKAVQLNGKRDQNLGSLSLGQKQRVAIIRALCQPFDFLLLDEPFSHLDPENIRILTEIINLEIKKRNAGLILTSLHDEYFFEYDHTLHL
ncbi:ABC transporter ATP-binding protein [Fulvitalea axinellae]|uniref:ABC transporter ATP-binding protein n=1 Tax=Fulvitalea axinellae TaxID=1182444 RepID=A0AAU9CLM0_9BACT|nr:ABC transporter ATP-binding protein [Fulvitalea axinellae]